MQHLSINPVSSVMERLLRASLSWVPRHWQGRESRTCNVNCSTLRVEYAVLIPEMRKERR